MTQTDTTATHVFRCGHPCDGSMPKCQFEDRHVNECTDCFAESQKRLAAAKFDHAAESRRRAEINAGIVEAHRHEHSAAGIAERRAAEAAEKLHDNDDAQIAGY